MTADYEEIKKWQKAMCEARKHLKDLIPRVAHARQVVELDGDRRKRLLARYTKRYLDEAGGSVAKAEVLARADFAYGKELDEWSVQLEAAFEFKDEWTATLAKLEAARSLHSVARDAMKI